MLPLLASLGVGVAGAIGKMISRGKSNRDMRSLIGKDPAYTTNPLAEERLALARTLFNARMPGVLRAEGNIYQNQSNQIGSIERNATSGSQALALGTAAYGQTNDAFQNLAQQEEQDQQRRYGNLVGAQEGMIAEGDKVFQDSARRFGDEVQLRGGIAANRANNWGDLSKMGFSLADYAMNGGFKGLFKKQPGATGDLSGGVGR